LLLSDFLIDMRKSSGKTQAEIALKLGISLRTWQNYEHDVSDISAKHLAIASLYCRYDINIMEIFGSFMTKAKKSSLSDNEETNTEETQTI
jgi:transcriptional regulator with XRE-family HTH domain